MRHSVAERIVNGGGYGKSHSSPEHGPDDLSEALIASGERIMRSMHHGMDGPPSTLEFTRALRQFIRSMLAEDED